MTRRKITDLSRNERADFFAQAGPDAVERAYKAGFPVTGTNSGQIVNRYPGGKDVVLKDLERQKD